MLVISLSTIPTRFSALGPTLESLLTQDIPIDRIEIYIPKKYKRFPDYDGSLPVVPKGIELIVIDEDYGPATKILPAVSNYKGRDMDILYCDDDRICPPNWARKFMEVRRYKKYDAIAASGFHLKRLGFDYNSPFKPRAIALKSTLDFRYRIRRLTQTIKNITNNTEYPKPRRTHNFWWSGYIDVMEGYGGVLVNPSMFDNLSYVIPSTHWIVDDIWLSGCLWRQKIGIWADKKLVVPEEQKILATPLCTSIINDTSRTEANIRCVKYFRENYGAWQ